jgi:hypothetical protein
LDSPFAPRDLTGTKMILYLAQRRGHVVEQRLGRTLRLASTFSCATQPARRPRIKRFLQRRPHKRSNLRLLRPPATSHVERLDLVLADEGCKALSGSFVTASVGNVQPGFAMLVGEVRRALAAAVELGRHREDHRPIAIADVPLGALQVGGKGGAYPKPQLTCD